MVQMSSSQGVLFLRNENEEYKWFQDGDEDKDGKYVGEIEYGEPNGQGTYTLSDGYKYAGEWKDGNEHGHHHPPRHQKDLGFNVRADWHECQSGHR